MRRRLRQCFGTCAIRIGNLRHWNLPLRTFGQFLVTGGSVDPGVTNYWPFSRYGRFRGSWRYELLAIFSLREVPWIMALRTFGRFLVTGGSRWLDQVQKCARPGPRENARTVASLSDTVVLEDVVKDFFGGQEVGAQDGVDAGEGAAQVFGHEVGGNAQGQGVAAGGQGR